MNAQKLKSSILQYAMQGKIIEQSQEDEPVEKLFQRIEMEKKELKKNGIMKPEVALAPITDEEIPFEIPESWKWERLGNLSSKIHYGYTASAQEKGNAKLLRITDIQNNQVNWETVPFCDIDERKLEALALKDRDILIARTGGTIGKSFLISSVDDISVFASYLIRVQPLTNIFEEYLIYYLQSDLYWRQLRGMSAGTGQPNVNAQNLKKLILPIPPIEEQKRIVDKIKTLEEQVVIYGNLYNQNEANRTKFPIDLEKSILQYAMQGKLVSQDNNDEPSIKLIEKIQKDKEELIKQKVIKKEKALSRITEEEIPFEIPGSWEWVRLGEIGFSNIGVTYKPSNLSSSGTAILRANNIFNNSIILNDVSYVDMQVRSNQLLYENDILICVRSGSEKLVGKSALVTKAAEGMSFGAFMSVYRSPFNEYIQYVISSSLFRSQLTKSRTTTINQITQGLLKDIIIPLPPLQEQKRIINKINELFNKTKNLY